MSKRLKTKAKAKHTPRQSSPRPDEERALGAVSLLQAIWPVDPRTVPYDVDAARESALRELWDVAEDESIPVSLYEGRYLTRLMQAHANRRADAEFVQFVDGALLMLIDRCLRSFEPLQIGTSNGTGAAPDEQHSPTIQ